MTSSTIAPTHTLYSRAAQLARDLSDALATPPPPQPGDDFGPRSRRWWDQSLSKGAAGVAVLHAAQGRPDLVHAWLTRAVREEISAAPGCGLWFGAPAIAFAVRAAGEHRYAVTALQLRRAVTTITQRRLAAATARIDATIRPTKSEFDLVRGLSGLGAHLLHPAEDGPADRDLLRAVLAYLVRLTEPLPVRDHIGRDAPGWWSNDIPSRADAVAFAGGHADLGAAHGICGPLALLSLATLHDVHVPGQTEAIERISTWLDRWRQHSPAGPWWPQRITLPELRAGQVTEQTGPGRPSWCYSTPGIARAQQLAGLALRDTARQDLAEHALLSAVTDPTQLSALSDPSLCHGWAGMTATVWHAARDARHPGLSHQIPGLLARLLTHTGNLAPAGPIGLIDGAAGVALTLHTITTDTSNGWARCLLLA